MQRESGPDEADLRAILASLGGEISRPLGSLRGEIVALLGDPSSPITDTERGQAETMLTLCDDLVRLTRDCLGIAGPTEG